MRVLIIGASGLLGSCLAGLLRERHEIWALDRDGGRFPFRGQRDIRFIEADLSVFDPADLPSGFDAVYYLAQSRRFREFPEGAKDMLAINVVAPARIAEWAMRSGVGRFYFGSTGGVYGNQANPVREDTPVRVLRGRGFYVDSKLSAEALLSNYASRFETFCIFRPFFVYGPGQEESMLIPRLIRSVSEGREVILQGEEGIRINPVFVLDAALASGKMLNLNGDHVFNIAGSEVVSLKNLSERVGEVCGRGPVFRCEGKSQPGLIGDISRMREMLHQPEVDLQAGIRATYEGMTR
jgi:nucleoside-diphosphate-sugar epimerase